MISLNLQTAFVNNKFGYEQQKKGKLRPYKWTCTIKFKFIKWRYM